MDCLAFARRRRCARTAGRCGSAAPRREGDRSPRAARVQSAGRRVGAAAWPGSSARSRTQQIQEDLHRAKQLLETGEITLSDGHGLWRAAQPAAMPQQVANSGRSALMRANCWHGTEERSGARTSRIRKILNARDAIVRITSTAICGSDLASLQRLHPDDEERRRPRPRVHGRGRRDRQRRQQPRRSATASWCRSRLRAATARSASARCTRSARTPTRMRGWPRRCAAIRRAGIFGYSHMLGGYAGGQAEYARVPFADVGPLKVPDSLTDEQVLFLSDIFPTGYMAAEVCNIQPGDTIAVWGCGPGRPVRDQERLPARRRAGDRYRSIPVPAATWRANAPARDDQLRGGGRFRGARRNDRRTRSRLAASTRSAWRGTRPA